MSESMLRSRVLFRISEKRTNIFCSSFDDLRIQDPRAEGESRKRDVPGTLALCLRRLALLRLLYSHQFERSTDQYEFRQNSRCGFLYFKASCFL